MRKRSRYFHFHIYAVKVGLMAQQVGLGARIIITYRVEYARIRAK